MNHLYPKQIIYLYQQIIEQTGGSVGLRSEGLLESAVYRPQASFGGQDLFSDLFSKAGALGHALISHHPFVDGNKRVGFEAMRLMLRLNGYDLRATVDAKYESTMSIAEGKLTAQQVADWLKQHSRTYRKG